MDNGIQLPFSDQGIDPAEFGMPLWTDGWHKVIIVGSAAKPLSDPSKGGRLQFKIKNEAGQEHFIGLNIWHKDPDTKARADRELASICHVTGRHQFNNTAELYNIPFFVLAETSTSAPTPAYPNPKPQTNFRGYRDLNGNEPGKVGGGAGGPSNGPPANFGGQPQQAQQPVQQAPAFQQQPQQPVQQFAQQPQQQQPQFGAPAGQMPQQQPQQQPFQQQPMQGNPPQQWQPNGAGPVQQQQPAQQFVQQPVQQQQPQFGQPQQQPQFAQQGAPAGGGTPPWQQ